MPTIKLTKKAIDEASPQASDQVYWDDSLRGFGLKVTPAGRKVFIVMYRTNDSRRLLRKFTIGPYGVLTLHSARMAAQKILLARLDGKDPAGEKQASRKRNSGLGVEEVLRRYREEHLEPRAVGRETIRILERVVLVEWKGRQITDITRSDIRDIVDTITHRGAITMAGRVFTVVRALLNWCVGRGLLEKSPCAGLSPPRANRARDRVLSDDELAVVLRTAHGLPYPYGPIVNMLALTGQRRSEVVNMQWTELDLEKRIWTVPAGRTKTKRSHVVHFAPQMMALLPDREAGQPLVFPSHWGKSFQGFSSMKKALDKASGVGGWVLHDLRRTVVSGMAALGVAPHVADKILNHQSGAISGIAAVYQRHEFMVERKAATELWSDHVDGILRAVREEERTRGAPECGLSACSR